MIDELPLNILVDLQAGHCECCPAALQHPHSNGMLRQHTSLHTALMHSQRQRSESLEQQNTAKLCTVSWPEKDSLSLQMLLLGTP